MKEYAIIGLPLDHTLSPLLHNQLFSEYSIDAFYSKYPLDLHDIPMIIEKLKSSELHGISVTAPYKENIIPYIDIVSEQARLANSVNTVVQVNGILYGYNTDIIGIRHSINNISKESTVLILGTGATSRSAIVALQVLGVKNIIVTGRNIATLKKLAVEYVVDYIEWKEKSSIKGVSLLINTIPYTKEGIEEPLLYKDFLSLGSKEFVSYAFDVGYSPKKNPFLEEASKAGWQIRSGLPMFLCQAKHQFFLWTGIFPDMSKVAEKIKRVLI